MFKKLYNRNLKNYKEFVDTEEIIKFGKDNFLKGIDDEISQQPHGGLYAKKWIYDIENIKNEIYFLGYKLSMDEIDEDEYKKTNEMLEKKKAELELEYEQVKIVEAFHRYSGNSRLINGSLRNRKPILDIYYDAFSTIHRTLQDVKISENIVVYRVFHSNEWDINNYKDFRRIIGKKIIDFGFLGTSLIELDYSKQDLQRNFNTLLKIYVPKGANGVFIEALSRRREYELLFQTNSILKILSVKWKKVGKEKNKELHILLNVKCLFNGEK